MKKTMILGGLAVCGVLVTGLLVSQPASRETPGPQPGGGFLLNSGWKITPAGTQVSVDTLPMSSVVSRDGKYLLVLNGGYNPPSVSVIDIARGQELSRVRVPDAWLGIALSAKGDQVYIGGGSKASVYEFLFRNGILAESRTITLIPEAKRTWQDFIGDVALSPDGRVLYAADIFHNRLITINTETGVPTGVVKTGRRPYRTAFLPGGKSYLVSNWADGTLSQFQTSDNASMGTIRTGPHPTDILVRPGKSSGEDKEKTWEYRVFVAAANTNNVYSLGASDAGEFKLLETINVAMTPRQPLGMTPTGLGLSADGKQLYVACSDANAIAVADVSEDTTHVKGFIPTGWYPTGVTGLADGRIAILNGKGLKSYPNPKGPGPLTRPEPPHLGIRSDEYVGTIQRGTVAFLAAPDDAKLYQYTQAVLANSPYKDSRLDEPVPEVLSRIKHVIYIVKENRTYDPMLGDMKEGNGDPSLVLFGEKYTPNQHKLAREFVLLDNFYVSADVSADGHNWSTAAIASDYVQKFWPNSYAARRKHYDYEGGEPAAGPPAGYLWGNAKMAGISMRNYGYFVNLLPTPDEEGNQVESVRDPILTSVTNMKYRGFDLNYSDVERVKVFQQDLKEYEAKGEMPHFMIMRLGNDHTSGTSPGKIAPLSSIADNDYALGKLVESVSKSKFWADTAIFVVEDDAQNGADHVDSHRSPAFVLSPYTRRGVVDSSMYNTVSMLRTMEYILGMRPMTHFDAGARPMTSVFVSTPNLTPYAAAPPQIPLDTRNPATSATAARSHKMNFEQEDAVDEEELNEVLWIAIKGKTPQPSPVRSYFSR
jgi:DNA-binding beta-propeller fold protein YncE